jgi:hypothetical protein
MVENLALAGQNLSWTHSDDVRYAIYAAPTGSTGSISSAAYLQGISYTKAFALPWGISTTTHRIAVSVYDRYGNEFAPCVLDDKKG